MLLWTLLLAGNACAASAPARIVLPEHLAAAVNQVRWTPALTDRLIREMPKVETHLHLDGALSPAMVKRLAVQQRYEPLAGKTLKEIRALSVVSKPKDSLGEVLQVFHTVYPLLHQAGALEQIAYDVVRRAKTQNIRHLEVRFAPVLQEAAGFTAEQALEAALKGLKRGERDFGVTSGVIVCLIRPFDFVSRDKNSEMTDLAIRYKDRGVVALDLAGNEAAQPLSDFRDLFVRAKAAGLKLTAHAGEAPGSPDLKTALDIGVDRLGHATGLAGQPDLQEAVRARGIPIEVNLTSNLRTSAVPDLASHPIKEWVRLGIPVTLSTDDPGVFGIDLNHEYGLLAHELSFDAGQILSVSLQGIDALFLPPAEKDRLRLGFETDLARVLGRLGARRHAKGAR